MLSIPKKAFYVVNWISRSPYGADLIEYETNLSWKVKKRLVGDVGRRQRNSTVDSWSRLVKRSLRWLSTSAICDDFMRSH